MPTVTEADERPVVLLDTSAADAERLLAHNFPEPAYLSENVSTGFDAELARLGIAGGSVYDALVGAAARHHGRALLTRDDRARPTYGALGVTLAVTAAE